MSEDQGDNISPHVDAQTPAQVPPRENPTKINALKPTVIGSPSADEDTSRVKDIREEIAGIDHTQKGSISAQTSSHDDDEQDEIERAETPEAILRKNIEAARTAITALVEFAIAYGVDPQKLSFIDEAFDEQAFSVIPDRYFNQAYKDIRGLSEEQAANIGAITDSSHGTVFMRESTVGKTHYVIHESTHRVNFLGRKATGTPKIEVLFADDYFLDVDENGKLQISEDLKEIFESEEMPDMVGFVKQLAKDVDEGFTEWTARKAEELAAQRGTPLPIEKADHAYPLHVEVVDNSILGRIVNNLGCSPERAQAIVIETTLTGDLTLMREALGENFREMMEQFVDRPRGNEATRIDY